jgi:serine/threonine protein kinase
MTKEKDKPQAEPAKASAGDLLTAQDIFGDVLDSLGEEYAVHMDTGAASGRQSPIKVQVTEPGDDDRPMSVVEPGGSDVLPEEISNLLDAFDPQPPPVAVEPEPPPVATAAIEPVLAVEAEPIVEAEPVVEAALAAEPIVDVEAVATPIGDPEPPTPESRARDPFATWPLSDSDVNDEEVVESLLPAGPDVSEADIAPSLEGAPARERRKPRKPRPGFSSEEALRDLQNLRPPSWPGKGGTAPSGPIDLAGLVEQALQHPLADKNANAVLAEGTYGPYRLVRKIAVGGMAEVFKAKRSGVEGFEKVVAVKRILPHLSDNKEFVEMFIDEAKMVAGLTHPNIVQISDLGKLEKSYYIAMEYVHGRDLRTILRRAKDRGLRLPLDLTVLIVSKVCSALEFAHRKKDERGRPMLIVHRDISPQNILISFEGEVKLTDFGIAKAATKARITDAGALRGKLLYMSPEQAWGKPMDRRSDVFSLGIVFYEMVTDQKPFLGSSEMSILEMVRECRVAPPSDVNPRIPERLEKVVMTALERDPDHRYQDAAEMYRDLDRVLHERQPPTANELTRFMELLFDEEERVEALPPGTGDAADEAAQEVEFEHPPDVASAEPPTSTTTDSGAIKDPLSIQKLLKRFGIK